MVENIDERKAEIREARKAERMKTRSDNAVAAKEA